MRIDPTTLKIFLTIIEEQSLARAAERHFMATSAVSKRISDLEDTLATQLLERHSGGVRPTAAGLQLVDHAKEMLILLARIRAEMSGYGTGAKGEIKVFANSTSIVGFLGHDIQSFLAQYPGVDVRLEEWSSPYIVRSLRDGLADIGLFWSGAATPGLITKPYRTAKLVVVVPESHVLATRQQVSFSETLEFDHIAFHEGSLIYQMTTAAAAGLNAQIRTRLQVTSFDAIRTMVRAGIGLAIITDVTVSHPYENHGFKVVPLTDEWAGLQILLGYRDYQALPRATQRFVEHLASTA